MPQCYNVTLIKTSFLCKTLLGLNLQFSKNNKDNNNNNGGALKRATW